MTVVIRAFARIREIVGAATLERELASGATAGDLWNVLVREFPELDALRRSTRLARGGSFVAASATLRERDEVSLLPPFGGG
ncbi:MAG: hypothetical protein NVS2B3_12120 [Vulcanimicrobiaceae bacterium]